MYPTLEDGLNIFIEDALLFEPGTSYSYSSYGYNLFGVVLEKAGKGDFIALLQEKVFQPLNLKRTREDHPYQLVRHRASAYNINSQNEWLPAGAFDHSYKWPSSGMIGTPSDLATLGLAFLKPGFLDKAELEVVFTPQPNAGNKSFQIGLGWHIGKDEGGRTIYHHGGAIEGGRAFFLLIPATQSVVVMMANAYARFGQKEALELAAIFTGEHESGNGD